MAGELPIEASLPQIWVDHDDKTAAARELIAAYFQQRQLGPPRKCAKCGEENPSSFEICWACGAALA